MSILAWIEDQKRLKLLNAPKYANSGSDSSKGLWTRCDKCGVILYIKHLKENQRVCFGCSYHLQMSSQERIENLLDKASWRALDETVSPCDPLEFQDQKKYTDRLQDAQEKTGLQDAIQTGTGMIDGIPVALGVMDFDFMGGSMGSVVGEKLTRLIEYATQEGLTLLIVCASGGARMQEGVFSLMQMAKISSALQIYQSCANLLYISILTSPTTGGVTASFAMLGDIIFAEPKALIAFAGRRVIEQTLREDLPDDFQTSEYMLHHGLLDLIVPRRFLRQALSESIRLYQNAPFKRAGRIPFGIQNPISFLSEEKIRRCFQRSTGATQLDEQKLTSSRITFAESWSLPIEESSQAWSSSFRSAEEVQKERLTSEESLSTRTDAKQRQSCEYRDILTSFAMIFHLFSKENYISLPSLGAQTAVQSFAQQDLSFLAQDALQKNKAKLEENETLSVKKGEDRQNQEQFDYLAATKALEYSSNGCKAKASPRKQNFFTASQNTSVQSSTNKDAGKKQQKLLQSFAFLEKSKQHNALYKVHCKNNALQAFDIPQILAVRTNKTLTQIPLLKSRRSISALYPNSIQIHLQKNIATLQHTKQSFVEIGTETIPPDRTDATEVRSSSGVVDGLVALQHLPFTGTKTLQRQRLQLFLDKASDASHSALRSKGARSSSLKRKNSKSTEAFLLYNFRSLSERKALISTLPERGMLRNDCVMRFPYFVSNFCQAEPRFERFLVTQKHKTQSFATQSKEKALSSAQKGSSSLSLERQQLAANASRLQLVEDANAKNSFKSENSAESYLTSLLSYNKDTKHAQKKTVCFADRVHQPNEFSLRSLYSGKMSTKTFEDVSANRSSVGIKLTDLSSILFARSFREAELSSSEQNAKLKSDILAFPSESKAEPAKNLSQAKAVRNSFGSKTNPYQAKPKLGNKAEAESDFEKKKMLDSYALPSQIDFLNQAIEMAATESIEWRAFYLHQRIAKTTGFLEDFLQPVLKEGKEAKNLLFYRSICRTSAKPFLKLQR